MIYRTSLIVLCVALMGMGALAQRANDVNGYSTEALPGEVKRSPLLDIPAGGVMAPVCPSGIVAFSGSNSQLGRIFRDGVPSTCPGKAYPGNFNPATSYFFETHTFANSTAAAACVTVFFDPNPDGNPATDCDVNAHASAYVGSYDPMNQSANFVGDVGSSDTLPFSFEIPAMSDLVLVVTNTSAEEVCNYSFSVTELECPTPAEPPVFSKSFSPNPVAAGLPTQLTLTIDNSANSIEATGLSFTDPLPVGLSVADPANASTTCTGGTLTATPGSGSISYAGGSVGASMSCTVTVDVRASVQGDHNNVTGDLTSVLGNSGPASSILEAFSDPAVSGIPTLSHWGILLLAGLIALAAYWRLTP